MKEKETKSKTLKIYLKNKKGENKVIIKIKENRIIYLENNRGDNIYLYEEDEWRKTGSSKYERKRSRIK